PSCQQGDDRPVEWVSWDDCQAFCEKLRQLTGKEFRLPTEAEWEYACRAGTTTKYSWGEADFDEYAWFDLNSGGPTGRDVRLHPVGQKKPNAWGLFDMNGNIWEWCHDWWHSCYVNQDVKDPKGPQQGSDRVLRGGSDTSEYHGLRATYRM